MAAKIRRYCAALPPSAGSWRLSSGTCCRRCALPTISRCAPASTCFLSRARKSPENELPQGCELAIAAGHAEKALTGQATREPAFGMPAWWVASEGAAEARNAGYTVVDPVSVLATHLSEICRRHAHELFSRQDAKKLLDRVAVDTSILVEDLVP